LQRCSEYSTKKLKKNKKIFLKKVLTAQKTKVSIVAFEVGSWLEGSSTEADHTVASRHHPLNRVHIQTEVISDLKRFL
jgi:hypothetical protein